MHGNSRNAIISFHVQTFKRSDTVIDVANVVMPAGLHASVTGDA